MWLFTGLIRSNISLALNLTWKPTCDMYVYVVITLTVFAGTVQGVYVSGGHKSHVSDRQPNIPFQSEYDLFVINQEICFLALIARKKSF